MKELVTRQQADTLFSALLVLGLVAGLVAAVIARRRRGNPLLAALAVGGPLLLVGAMWPVYNAITDRIGLDTVKNLLVNAILFVAVGIACGVFWAWLTTRRIPGSVPPDEGDGPALIGAEIPGPRRPAADAKPLPESES